MVSGLGAFPRLVDCCGTALSFGLGVFCGWDDFITWLDGSATLVVFEAFSWVSALCGRFLSFGTNWFCDTWWAGMTGVGVMGVVWIVCRAAVFEVSFSAVDGWFWAERILLANSQTVSILLGAVVSVEAETPSSPFSSISFDSNFSDIDGPSGLYLYSSDEQQATAEGDGDRLQCEISFVFVMLGLGCSSKIFVR